MSRLLEAGVNVCSSAAWITGGKQTPEDLERIRKACEKGNSTIFGSGAHPGMTNMVGMVLVGRCERVDEIRITESVDCSTYESAGTQAAMGFGRDPETPGLAESVRRESEVFAESAAMMADAIGAKLDRMTFDVEFTTATGDSDLGFMQIPEGTVGGVYGYHRGWVGDRNVVSVGFNWTMGSHVTPPKPLEHGHVIQVFGTPNMRTVLHCLPPRDWTEPGFMGLGMIYTAMPVTNAVPAVVAAAPGIVTLRICRRSPAGSSVRGALPTWPYQAVQVAQCVGSAGHGHQQRLAGATHLRALAMGPVRVGGHQTQPADPPRPADRRGISHEIQCGAEPFGAESCAPAPAGDGCPAGGSCCRSTRPGPRIPHRDRVARRCPVAGR